MTTALLAALGVALDAALGEPRRWHPLVGFGALAMGLERRVLASPGLAERPIAARLAGAGAVAALVVPPVALVAAAAGTNAGAIVDVVALSLALGARSLGEHAAAVAEPLAAGDLATARGRVALIVSRETGALDADGWARLEVALEAWQRADA